MLRRTPALPVDSSAVSSGRFYVETLGCPKNQVDSDKLIGTLLADGMQPSADPAAADLVVVNTCAFIEAARQESIDTILALDEQRRPDARLVVTGCLAERYGDELAAALPEVDQVAGFGVPVNVVADAADDPRQRCADGSELRPANLARPPIGRAVGLREDRRGMRPHVRVLCHPIVPWSSAQPFGGVDPDRGRSAAGAGSRARGAGPRLVRQGSAR